MGQLLCQLEESEVHNQESALSTKNSDKVFDVEDENPF